MLNQAEYLNEMNSLTYNINEINHLNNSIEELTLYRDRLNHENDLIKIRIRLNINHNK